MTQPSMSDEEQRDAANSATYLSERESEILTLVAEGRTDNEIAILLCMSAKTVSWYVKEIRSPARRPIASARRGPGNATRHPFGEPVSRARSLIRQAEVVADCRPFFPAQLHNPRTLPRWGAWQSWNRLSKSNSTQEV